MMTTGREYISARTVAFTGAMGEERGEGGEPKKKQKRKEKKGKKKWGKIIIIDREEEKGRRKKEVGCFRSSPKETASQLLN